MDDYMVCQPCGAVYDDGEELEPAPANPTPAELVEDGQRSLDRIHAIATELESR